MTVEPVTLTTILGMALITYATRAGGLWFMSRRSTPPRLQSWLHHLPGTLLVAIVVPAAAMDGIAGALAALGTLLIAARTGNVLLALVSGVAVAQLTRAVI